MPPVNDAVANQGSEPLSLVVTVTCFNNQDTIGRTLASVRGLAQAIVCVDSGSTDGTTRICTEHGARVINQCFLGYVRQKQFALEAGARLGMAWTLHLDSDESLEPGLQASLREAVARDEPAIGGYEINRKVHYAGRLLEHAWQPEWRLRLVRTGKAHWCGYDPHDKLELTDTTLRTARLAGDCRHDSIPSMSAFLSRQVSHARIAAESYRAMGRRGKPSKVITSPAGAFLKQMVRCRAYRDGWRGWACAGAASAGAMMKHIMLLESTHVEDANRNDAGSA
jgi:glycosyltransferase involved in cell wall biosynthesis